MLHSLAFLYKEFLLLLIFILCSGPAFPSNVEDSIKNDPTVFVSLFIRNKAHVLPYFLTALYQLEYPKHRIILWICSDHNEDNSVEIVHEWLTHVKMEYHDVKFIVNETDSRYKFEKNIADWTEERYNHMIYLREEALMKARYSRADFIWFLDCDVFLTEPLVLRKLLFKKKVVVAPMLSTDGMYSNFWSGMESDYYYKRTEMYEQILNHKIRGCYEVPMVHSCVLIDLRSKISDKLSYAHSNIPNYDGPIDDIIIFAVIANLSDVPLHVCNDNLYGYIMTPMDAEGTLEYDKSKFTNFKLFISSNGPPLALNQTLKKFVKFPLKTTFGLDRIYLINLQRRKERRQRMTNCFDELGLNVTFMNAVDGKSLDEAKIKELGIVLLSGYEDPYHKRFSNCLQLTHNYNLVVIPSNQKLIYSEPIKLGEIGCFLSHYNIWNHALKNGYKEIMVLEDDVQFVGFFAQKLLFLLYELRQPNVYWDLVYIGRKIVHNDEEIRVRGTQRLVYAGYSYWTIGYLLSANGIRKLIDAVPFSKLLPVDEFLPIMYDKHPRDDWKSYYPKRNLIALSAAPLLIFPFRYIDENGYTSDTEDSSIINSTIHDEF